MFGLEPNFGCCTANMHQGWPKYTARLWMATNDNGLAVVSYSPCTLKTKVGNETDVTIKVETLYPFKENVSIKISLTNNTSFPMKLRIPEWCSNPKITINGELQNVTQNESGYVTLERIWKGEDHIELLFPMRITLQKRADFAVSLMRGPLVYVLKIEEKWRKRSGNDVFPNMEVVPLTPWNYGLKVNLQQPESSFTVEEKEIVNQPFDYRNAPVVLKGKGKKLPQWTLEKNSAGTLPISPVQTTHPEEDVELIPYGSARLRIGEFPWVK
jgi:DUF1680 family protein